MRILVTGGAGFIGSHFAKRLAAAGDEVVVLDKLTYSGNRANLEGADVEFFEGDICDAGRGRRGRPPAARRSSTSPPRRTSTARSSAPPSSSRPTCSAPTSCSATRASAGIRLVQVSTDEVYGDVAARASARAEDDPLRPSSPYSASKAGGDLQVLAAVRTFGIDACITRGANTYGPNQYPEKLIPLFVTNALDGEPLPVYGDGRQRREWLHVDDHCAAVELVLREGAPARSTTSAARSTRTSRSRADPRADRRRPGARPPRRRPAGPRPPLLARRLEAPRRSAGSREHSLEGASPRPSRGTASNRAWWEPIKSGDYRDVLRAAVRRAARLAASSAGSAGHLAKAFEGLAGAKCS